MGNPRLLRESADSIHLILHQSDQWGYHNGRSILHQGWQLVAKGFSTPSGHDGDGIFTRKDCVDYFLLSVQEIPVTEVFIEGLAWVL